MARQVSLRGKRFSVFDRPRSWRTTSTRSAASPRSRTVKLGSRPTRRAFRRMRRLAIAWNVPDHGKRTCFTASATMRCARRVISSAARREKVSSRMRSGAAPASSRCATRCASVFVLPVPAPARISSGPSPNVAASRCRVFNLSIPNYRRNTVYSSIGVSATFRDSMRTLAPEILKGIRRGIEKESLRVRADGSLSALPHPQALGAALTHPHITTDFSESQLELITGAHQSLDTCLEELTEVHKVVYRSIGGKAGDELMWAGSMPCNLPADDAIPIGRYGKSNVGRAKTVYRQGLSHRYGRRMQTI